MRALALTAFLPLALCACTPKPAPTPIVQLDCAVPFEALRAKILAQAGIDAKPAEPGEPYRAYSLDDGRVAYMITEPGAPAHPAILMQEAGGGAQRNTGCGYGSRAAYDELAKYLTGLRAATHGT